jgi:hypothetical protein
VRVARVVILEHGVVAPLVDLAHAVSTQHSKERDTTVITVFDLEELGVSQL